MSSDVFDNHPMSGSMLDFDWDGLLDFGEAAFMGALAAHGHGAGVHVARPDAAIKIK